MGRVISDLRTGNEPRWEIPFSGENPYQRVMFMFKSLVHNHCGRCDYDAFRTWQGADAHAAFQQFWRGLNVKQRREDPDLVWERYLVLVDTECIAPVAACLEQRVNEGKAVISVAATS